MAEILIVPEPRFGIYIEEIKNDPGISGASILDALVAGLRELKKYDWYKTFPDPLYSAYGDAFAWRFHRDYVLTFEREVIWESSEKPKRIVLKLGSIQRA